MSARQVRAMRNYSWIDLSESEASSFRVDDNFPVREYISDYGEIWLEFRSWSPEGIPVYVSVRKDLESWRFSYVPHSEP